MRRFVLLSFALAVFAPLSISAQSAAANKAWSPFLAKFTSAVKAKDRRAILALAVDGSRFARDAGGDSREDMVAGLKVSDLRSGFKAWQGGKITRKGCIWFKFIDNRWYWAGTPCD
jgi:hypothetical protein